MLRIKVLLIEQQAGHVDRSTAISHLDPTNMTALHRGLARILLRQHPSLHLPHTEPQHVRDVLLGASSLLLHRDIRSPGALASALSNLSHEAVQTQIDVFTSLLSTPIEFSLNITRNRLVDQYPILARAIALALRGVADLLAVQDSSGEGAQMLSAVLVVVRLAVYAADQPAWTEMSAVGQDSLYGVTGPNREADTVEVLDTFWRRISPDWYRLIYLSLDSTCINGVSSPFRGRLRLG